MATIEVKVPPLGESVTEATVAQWLKKKGEAVAMDDPLVELETDKVTLEINAPASGVLADIKHKEGATVTVDTILGIIEEGAAVQKEAPAPTPPPKAAPAPAPTPTPAPASAAEKLSPAVRKMVDENNLQPQEIPGSGKEGRIIKEDVQAFMTHQPTTSTAPTESGKQEERVKMTRLRRTIATRLKEAQNTAAMLTSFNEIDMSKVIEARQQYKESFEKKHGIRLGFMGFFVKASVIALKEIPVVNAEIVGDEVVYKNYYDISVAVSTPQGLVVPVVRQADKLSFAQIEKEIADLSKKGREGTLTMKELTGGTFTITNGGVFGSLLSTPIINPPQSGILGMHKIQERPVAINGSIVIRPMMYIALTYDHRIVDGREAVTFLVRLKECIEDPERMLLAL